MPEDRFGDLGADAPDREELTAAEKFAELDETDPEPKPRRPDPPRPSGRYTWVVGVAALIVIVIGGIRVASQGSGAGLKGPDPGTRLPEFAAPLAAGPVTGDSNIKPRSARSGSGGTPACDLHLPGTLNVCEEWKKPLVISFLFLRGAKCEPEFDRLDRLRAQFPGVNFLGVLFERDRSKARDVVRQNGWKFPVVVDHDGAVPNLYSVGGCPMTIFAYRGGKVRESHPGKLDDRQMQAAIRAIER